MSWIGVLGCKCYICFVSKKYKTPENEAELLPNKLGLTTLEAIEKQELIGFAKSAVVLTSQLTDETIFDVDYINNLHKLAFGHLYEFGGKYRTVNMSKGGFTFPAARFLEQSMGEFQNNILSRLKHSYESKQELINDIADVHGELLFIHPYREGNGRTARLLADLMAQKSGFATIKWELLQNRFEDYVKAVQQAGLGNYDFMRELITQVFPNS